MPDAGPGYFHLHLVSDSTGETLIATGRAVTAQYENMTAIEHVAPLVRSASQLDRIIRAIEDAPGIVLYTLVNQELADRLEAACKEIGCPCLSVLAPVVALFQSYLGVATTHRPGAQHVLNADYFRRIDAMNYTMAHDDGQQTDHLEEADVVLVGVSRTSKTPTCIYLANRGIKAANVPLVPSITPPAALGNLKKPLVVGLIASPERIVQIRQNRVLALKSENANDTYIDYESVMEEITFSRRYCARHEWPIIDVTRRSIEETAAAIVRLYDEHRMKGMER